MKWIKDPLEGTEALYLHGKNDKKVIAHCGGILGLVTLSLDPTVRLLGRATGIRQPRSDSDI